jgi:hypothetical protein
MNIFLHFIELILTSVNLSFSIHQIILISIFIFSNHNLWLLHKMDSAQRVIQHALELEHRISLQIHQNKRSHTLKHTTFVKHTSMHSSIKVNENEVLL